MHNLHNKGLPYGSPLIMEKSYVSFHGSGNCVERCHILS